MEKEFVTYEQALALKELGFDEECLYVKVMEYGNDGGFYTHTDYNDYPKQRELEINMPLKQQVFRWFREKYDAHIHPSRLMRNIYVVRYGDWDSTSFTTYEEAENACIDKLIEIAKQQDNGK